MNGFFVSVLLLLFLAILPGNVRAQVVRLAPDAWVKVDVKMQDTMDVLHHNDPFFYGTHEDVDDAFLLQLTDSLTLFYRWQPEGVFQIVTWKKLRGRHANVNLKRSYKFEDLWKQGYKESFRQVSNAYAAAGCRITAGTEMNMLDNNTADRDGFFAREALLEQCALPFLLDSPKAAKWLYYPVSINFYHYPVDARGSDHDVNNPETIRTRTLDRYYSFASLTSRYWKERFGRNQEQSHLKYQGEVWLANWYPDLGLTIVQENYPNGLWEYISAAEVPVMSKVMLRNLHDDTPRTFMTDVGVLNNSLVQRKQNFEASFRAKWLENSRCRFGYVLDADEEDSSSGTLVVPGEFFLPNRLKIVSVDDIPWETYKMQLCEK